MRKFDRNKERKGSRLFIPMRGYESYQNSFVSYAIAVIYPHEGL